MAIIYRETGSLTTLMEEFTTRGINEFNSFREIVLFPNQFENKKSQIIEITKSEINEEVISKRKRIKKYKKELKTLIETLTDELNLQIERYSEKLNGLRSKRSKNVLIRIINKFRYYRISKKLNHIRQKFEKIIEKKSQELRQNILVNQSAIDYILNNKENVLYNRSKKEIEYLTYTYDTLDELRPLIAGAIGEELVVKEIQKLPDNYILINDFSLKFNRPIYNKRNRDRIYSIQIDHILVSPAGVFLIETKNWSMESLNNYDLRSPVEQIQRTSFAMFVIFNSDRFRGIGSHHWGESRIPIKKLIVMINHKPKYAFKYVKILELSELRHYLLYFDDIYTPGEVNMIANELLDIVNG